MTPSRTVRSRRLQERLSRQGCLVSDGAWGTLLQARGLEPGECPEYWNCLYPDRVREIARLYFEAGADMVETNSFGGSSCKLSHFGLETTTAEINRAAASLSREAVGPDGLVIASVGPTGIMLLMGETSPDELQAIFHEQIAALAEGGADAICIETMSDLEEARLAIAAARLSTQLEVICTFTFEITRQGEFRTMMGLTPEQAAAGAVEAGADIIGANCGNGMEQMVPIITSMYQVVGSSVPILVHANAGLPETKNGSVVFPETPEEMAARVPALREAGASIIGGCCGTTPDHIRAIRQAVEALRLP